MSEEKNIHRYDDIMGLPHHVSKTRPHMSLQNRAAQFAPFAALTGFGAVVAEKGRLTDEKIELDEHAKEVLDKRLAEMMRRLEERLVATWTYFVPDEKKEGGKYVTVTDVVKKIDQYRRLVILENGSRIPIGDIVEIQPETGEQ